MEMITGAKYTLNGKWFTFVEPSQTFSRMGLFRDDSGKIRAILMDVFESAPSKEPTPFPEPERWKMSDLSTASFVWAQGSGFYCMTNNNAKTAIALHNSEIDRLMGEIRRLESLVESRGAK